MKKIILIICLLLVSCTPSNNEIKGRWINIFSDKDIVPANISTRLNPFNTVMYIRYFIEDSTSDEEEEALINSIQNVFEDEVVRLHKLFDRHYPYWSDDSKETYVNNIYQIHQIYGLDEELIVDRDLIKVLKLGIEYTKASEGKFNFFVGTLSDAWDNIFEEIYNFTFIDEIDPFFNEDTKKELENIAACIPSYQQIEEILVIDEDASTVKFNLVEVLDKNGENICGVDSKYRPTITLGGIGKGYATKVLVERLNSLGYKDGQLLSGGSSISALGASFLEKGQQITIADPRSSGYDDLEPVVKLRIKEKFDMSTSGNYTTGKSYSFINFENEEIVYRHHILDPMTGLPSNYHRSVTIVSEDIDAAILDVLSTILVNLTIEDGLAFRNIVKQEGLDFDAIWINQIGTDRNITCESDSWCPTYPSSLTVTSTSSFNNSLMVKEGVTLNYVT